MSEEEIVRRALAGDQDAYRVLYDQNLKRLQGMLFRWTQNTEDAKEIAHEALAHAFSRLGSFRGEAQFASWVGTIAINFTRMRHRKFVSSAAVSVSLDDDSVIDWKEKLGAVDGNQVGVIDRMALAEAIVRLPKGLKQVFMMAYVEGLEAREIAKVLRITVPATKARMYRARLLMKEILLEGKMPDDSQIEYTEEKLENAIPIAPGLALRQPSSTIPEGYEKCKAGVVKKGVCLTPGCTNERHSLDTTGYCRECKPKHGFMVAPSRKKSVREDGNVQHGAVRNIPVQDQEDLVMDEAFINEIWAFIPQEERVTILQLLWPKLPKLVKVAAIRMALERKKTQARSAVVGG